MTFFSCCCRWWMRCIVCMSMMPEFWSALTQTWISYEFDPTSSNSNRGEWRIVAIPVSPIRKFQAFCWPLFICSWKRHWNQWGYIQLGHRVPTWILWVWASNVTRALRCANVQTKPWELTTKNSLFGPWWGYWKKGLGMPECPHKSL